MAILKCRIAWTDKLYRTKHHGLPVYTLKEAEEIAQLCNDEDPNSTYEVEVMEAANENTGVTITTQYAGEQYIGVISVKGRVLEQTEAQDTRLAAIKEAERILKALEIVEDKR